MQMNYVFHKMIYSKFSQQFKDHRADLVEWCFGVNWLKALWDMEQIIETVSQGQRIGQ